MQTEDIVRQPRRDDPYAISRALRDSGPVSFSMLTAKGEPVELCSAGYVLHSGHSYRIRVVSALSETEVKDILIHEHPEFLTINPATREADERGQSVTIIPFRVSSLHTYLKGIVVQFGELEIAQPSADAKKPEVMAYRCPVVLRPGVGVVIAYLLIAIALPWLISKVVLLPFAADELGPDAIGNTIKPFASWIRWSWFTGGLLVIGFLFEAWNFFWIWRRSKELHGNFETRFPRPKELEQAPAKQA